MKRIALSLMLLVVLGWTAPAPGQWFFNKKPKVDPNQRVPELILTLKTDPDEKKRAHAAEELRDYDTKTFAEIVPVLADVLLHDKKQSVRLEALMSLAKIRPVSSLAGHAMEKAASSDDSLRVRLQAKTALPKYHLAGYSSTKSDATTVKKKQTDEPPIEMPPPSKNGDAVLKVQPTPMGTAFPRPLPPGVTVPGGSNAPAAEGPSLFPK